MKKKIRQVTGTQIGVTFTKEEREINSLSVGDVVDLSDMVVLKKDRKYISEESRFLINEEQNFKCKLCNKNLITSHIHHIDVDRSNNDRKNLVAFCMACHNLVHSKKMLECGVKYLGKYPDRKFIFDLNKYRKLT